MNRPMSLNDDDKDWVTVVSKKSQKKEKLEQHRQRVEQYRKNRDVRYLHTHVGFQKNRVTRDKAAEIVNSFKEKHPDVVLDFLFLVSSGRCVGHIISVTPQKQNCLQCDWTTLDGFDVHCCCSPQVVNSLPPNFYLGCDGYLDDYLVMMKEEPLKL